MKLHELFETTERSVLSVLGKQPCKYMGNFDCSSLELISLEGSPNYVGSSFMCNDNKLSSLKGAPSVIKGGLGASVNKLTSLQGINKIIKEIDGGTAYFISNPIMSHVLGLLRIKGLTHVYLDNRPVQDILNRHLEGDRDIFACQSELLDAGLEDFAQL